MSLLFFIYSMMELLICIWAFLTKSQCRVSDTQVTVKACGPRFLSLWMLWYNHISSQIWCKLVSQVSHVAHWPLVSSPNQYYDLIIALLKCVYWIKMVSQMSNVAHGPLVFVMLVHWIQIFYIIPISANSMMDMLLVFLA